MRIASRWLAVMILTLAAPAAWADWIVTKDHGMFEIRGSWKQQGKMIVFTSMAGTLSSMRSDRVDFEASKKATDDAAKAAAEASEPAPAPTADEAKPKKRAAWVLTDKDFKKNTGDGSEPSADAATGPAARDTSKDVVPGSSSGLKITKWDRVNPTDPTTVTGVQLSGKVQNTSADLQSDLSITASFFDDAGTALGKFVAVLTNSKLQPNESADFTVVGTGVWNFSTVKFELHATGFKLHPPPAAAAKPADGAPPPPPPPSF